MKYYNRVNFQCPTFNGSVSESTESENRIFSHWFLYIFAFIFATIITRTADNVNAENYFRSVGFRSLTLRCCPIKKKMFFYKMANTTNDFDYNFHWFLLNIFLIFKLSFCLEVRVGKKTESFFFGSTQKLYLKNI